MTDPTGTNRDVADHASDAGAQSTTPISPSAPDTVIALAEAAAHLAATTGVSYREALDALMAAAGYVKKDGADS